MRVAGCPFRRHFSAAAAAAAPTVSAGECTDGRSAVVLRSDCTEVKVLLGGGHISSIRCTNLPPGVEDVNPLWQPPWQTADPSLRRLLGPQIGEPGGTGDGLLEGQLLSCIAGHNLTCDVFGAHSAGEVGHQLCTGRFFVFHCLLTVGWLLASS